MVNSDVLQDVVESALMVCFVEVDRKAACSTVLLSNKFCQTLRRSLCWDL